MPNPSSPSTPLTLTQAAERTNLSERFLRREVQRGRLAVVRPGRFLRFRLEDLDAYLDDRRVPALDSAGSDYPNGSSSQNEALSESTTGAVDREEPLCGS